LQPSIPFRLGAVFPIIRLPLFMRGRTLNPIVLVSIVLLASRLVCAAASGTWTNDASSVWSAGTNWLDGAMADGTGYTAEFSTIDISANRTVTLDS
jgi:hypothetical protein